MNKALTILSLILAAALLALNITGALAEPEDMNGQVMADFSVETIDGSVFTLSESLRTHDLVLINFWASWCGPCCMEFPYLEQAWQQYSGRVDVIALSVEAGDSFDDLRGFASEYGLSFPIGSDSGNLFGGMGGYAIPTTLIVDRNMRVVAVEIGSKASVEEFTELFDSLLPDAPAPGSARCVLTFRDAAGNPVPGVTVAFCNGTYTSQETDASGCVTFEGDPNEFHVHLLGVPAGFQMPWEELHVLGGIYDLTVTLYPG